MLFIGLPEGSDIPHHVEQNEKSPPILVGLFSFPFLQCRSRVAGRSPAMAGRRSRVLARTRGDLPWGPLFATKSLLGQTGSLPEGCVIKSRRKYNRDRQELFFLL